MFEIAEINQMNATKAREIAEQVISEGRPSIDHLLHVVYDRIEREAKSGKCRLKQDPLRGVKSIVSTRQRSAVHAHLCKRGFKVTSRKGHFSISWG